MGPVFPLLSLLLPTLPDAPRAPLRVYLDAGHGAPGNSGNEDAACRDEQDVMLAVASHVAAGLTATGRYAVRPSREGGERPAYPDRLAAAQAFGAEVLISLHSDARGTGTWAPVGDRSCVQNDSQPGFAVLWSDEGPLAEPRRSLARSVAGAMLASGLLAYDGYDYGGLYEGDAEVAGVFVDRHEPRRRIMMLRRPSMPSVIVETHHAWHPAEAAAWQEPATWDRLVVALDAALQVWRG